MPDITDLAAYSGITNDCKAPRNFDFPEMRIAVGFIWFEASL